MILFKGITVRIFALIRFARIARTVGTGNTGRRRRFGRIARRFVSQIETGFLGAGYARAVGTGYARTGRIFIRLTQGMITRVDFRTRFLSAGIAITVGSRRDFSLFLRRQTIVGMTHFFTRLQNARTALQLVIGFTFRTSRRRAFCTVAERRRTLSAGIVAQRISFFTGSAFIASGDKTAALAAGNTALAGCRVFIGAVHFARSASVRDHAFRAVATFARGTRHARRVVRSGAGTFVSGHAIRIRTTFRLHAAAVSVGHFTGGAVAGRRFFVRGANFAFRNRQLFAVVFNRFGSAFRSRRTVRRRGTIAAHLRSVRCGNLLQTAVANDNIAFSGVGALVARSVYDRNLIRRATAVSLVILQNISFMALQTFRFIAGFAVVAETRAGHRITGARRRIPRLSGRTNMIFVTPRAFAAAVTVGNFSFGTGTAGRIPGLTRLTAAKLFADAEPVFAGHVQLGDVASATVRSVADISLADTRSAHTVFAVVARDAQPAFDVAAEAGVALTVRFASLTTATVFTVIRAHRSFLTGFAAAEMFPRAFLTANIQTFIFAAIISFLAVAVRYAVHAFPVQTNLRAATVAVLRTRPGLFYADIGSGTAILRTVQLFSLTNHKGSGIVKNPGLCRFDPERKDRRDHKCQ